MRRINCGILCWSSLRVGGAFSFALIYYRFFWGLLFLGQWGFVRTCYWYTSLIIDGCVYFLLRKQFFYGCAAIRAFIGVGADHSAAFWTRYQCHSIPFFSLINTTKKRGSKQSCLSRLLGLRIASQLRISNVEAHAVMKYYRYRNTMYITPMDAGHRVIVQLGY